MKIKASVKSAALSITNDAGETVFEYTVKDVAYEGDVGGLADALASQADQLKAAGDALKLAFAKTGTEH